VEEIQEAAEEIEDLLKMTQPVHSASMLKDRLTLLGLAMDAKIAESNKAEKAEARASMAQDRR
jgi:hypothetical protein